MPELTPEPDSTGGENPKKKEKSNLQRNKIKIKPF
jgi:hypothetical protein